MKKILLLCLLFCSCKNDKQILTSTEWVLNSESGGALGADIKFYTEQENKMTFKFNNDGTFYYAEDGIGKGEPILNKWQLNGDHLDLQWNGVYVNKANTLRISRLTNESVILINDNSPELTKPILIFLKKGLSEAKK